MCNLLGVYSVNKLDPKLLEMVAAIQVNASADHADGFGYFSSSEDFNKTWLAADISAYPRNLLDLNCEWVITHIRKTSSGHMPPPKKDAEKEVWEKWRAQKQAYAHPFVFTDVVVAHNGTFNKKNGHDYEMDSQFFSEQFQRAYAESQDVDASLEKAFDFFDGGLASLLLAVKYDGMFIPYFLKGNKPLHVFHEEVTNTTFVITEKRYFEPFRIIYAQLHGYRFTYLGEPKEGLYSPYTSTPLYEKKYIEQKVTTKYAQTTYGYMPNRGAPDNAVISSTHSNILDDFVKEIGKSTMAKLAERIVNEFTDKEIAKFLDLPERTVVDILADMHKGATVTL